MPGSGGRKQSGIVRGLWFGWCVRRPGSQRWAGVVRHAWERANPGVKGTSLQVFKAERSHQIYFS